jgi:hypothetical protein
LFQKLECFKKFIFPDRDILIEGKVIKQLLVLKPELNVGRGKVFIQQVTNLNPFLPVLSIYGGDAF